MKLLVVLIGVTALCSGSPLPDIPLDNSHYVEGESRYGWMPDGDGILHLVDLHETEDEASLQSRNGGQNQYWLFTRRNRNNRQVLQDRNINSVRNSNYNANRPIVVIAHGWRGSGGAQVNTLITSAFLDTQDCNVIVLDWSRAASGPSYSGPVRAVPSVGQHLGNFLVWLINNAGGNWNNVHLVGFSLGAHVVGNAGRTAGGRPRRITGLDPAGPQFGTQQRTLHRNDGQYVEAIHTDGGWYGVMDPIANADFYPNGGNHRQPGCGAASNSCSHSRAFHLFAATVRRNHLNGRACSGLNQVSNPNNCNGSSLRMGNGDINKRGSGIFALRTRDSYPF